MKKHVYTTIALFVLIGSMALAAQAQSNGRTEMIANIPFEFSAAGKTLPAGEYTLVQLNPASDQTILQLRSRDGSAVVMVQMSSVTGKAHDTAQLSFNRYGAKYFFAQAWIDGSRSGLQAMKSRAERTVGGELAGIKAQQETITLAKRK